MLACGSQLRAEKGQWPLVVEVGVAWVTVSATEEGWRTFCPHNSLTVLSCGFCPKWKHRVMLASQSLKNPNLLFVLDP